MAEPADPSLPEWRRPGGGGQRLGGRHGRRGHVYLRGQSARGRCLLPIRGGNDVCGTTFIDFEADGRITSVDIQVVQAIFRGPECQRTVVHETGHAIGFLAHTADGGLMDPDGGNGVITQEDVTFIQSLYALAPGTFVGLAERIRSPLGRSGRRSVTIVDPVRR